MIVLDALRVLRNYDLSEQVASLADGVYLLIDSINRNNKFNYDGPWHIYNGLWNRPTQWQEYSPFIPNCTVHIQSTQDVYSVSAYDVSTSIICYCSDQYIVHPCYQYVQNMYIVRTTDTEPRWNWVTFAIHDDIDVDDTDVNRTLPVGKYLLTNAYSKQQRCSGIWHKTNTTALLTPDPYIRPNQVVHVYQGAHIGNLYHLYYTKDFDEQVISILHVASRAPIIVSYVSTDDRPDIQRQPILQPNWRVYGPDVTYTTETHDIGHNILHIHQNQQNLFTVATDNKLHRHTVCQIDSRCDIDTQLLVSNPLSTYHGYRWHCTQTVERVTENDRPFWRVVVPSYIIQNSYDYIVPHSMTMTSVCSLLAYKDKNWPIESVAVWSDSGYYSTPLGSILNTTGDSTCSRILSVWHESTGPWHISLMPNATTFRRPQFYANLHDIGEILVPVLKHDKHKNGNSIIYFRNVHRLPFEDTHWIHVDSTPTSIITNNVTILGSQESGNVSSGSLMVQGGVGINGNIHCGNIFIQSDERLKQNVRPIRRVMRLIRRLRPKQYNLGDRSTSAGLIAQDVHKIAPYLTHTNHNGMLCINYIAILPLIIKAIQILHNRSRCTKERKRKRQRRRTLNVVE